MKPSCLLRVTRSKAEGNGFPAIGGGNRFRDALAHIKKKPVVGCLCGRDIARTMCITRVHHSGDPNHMI